ncbi:MAG: hypothetical protein JKY31_02495 [Rhodobacteraceae bacterium]|nr:hypothetical protein [Paracoccaceae bacterium]
MGDLQIAWGNVMQILPLTVFAAIALFAVKEGVEFWRRYKGNNRKRRALRKLLADEVERNFFQIKRIRDCANTVERAIDEGVLIAEKNVDLSIIDGAFGRKYLRLSNDKRLTSQMPIGEVHNNVLSTNLLEIAIVDNKIFESALETSDAIKELEHLLMSLVEQVTSFDNGFIDGFSGYVRSETVCIEATLKNFYNLLTGKELEQFRIR